VEETAAALAAADAAMKSALVPYIQAVKDENKAITELATANAWTPPSPETWAVLHTAGHSTGVTDIGDRSTHWIDRQWVDCGAYPLNQFRLSTHNGGSKIRYDYKCARNLKFSSPADSETSQENDGNGDIIFLDRLYADCGSTKAMSMFRYAIGNYQFKCMTPVDGQVSSCRTVRTSYQSKGGGGKKIEFLDRQDVKCSHTEVLQAFGLELGNEEMRYKYKCCRVTGGADQTFRRSKAAAIATNTAEINRCTTVISEAQQVQATAKALYEPEAVKRTAAVAKLAPLLEISTHAETESHFEDAKSRCQPNLLCTQSVCHRHASSNPCEPWPACYPHPCHPWPACSQKLPSGGYATSLKPLAPEAQAQADVAKVLQSYDAAAGYDAYPAVGYTAERLERGSTGPEAFDHEFRQR